jgi:hypothetical protein
MEQQNFIFLFTVDAVAHCRAALYYKILHDGMLIMIMTMLQSTPFTLSLHHTSDDEAPQQMATKSQSHTAVWQPP